MSRFPLPSGDGILKRVAGTDPAANTECSDAVPPGKWWVLLSVRLALAQGLTQTPQPILIIDDGANEVFGVFGSSAAQAASTTCVYTFGAGLPLSGQVGSGANVHATAPIPDDLCLPPGYRIRTSTLGIGANSDYAAPVYFVCELGD